MDKFNAEVVTTIGNLSLASINTEIRSLYSVSLKLCGGGVEKCVLCVGGLGRDCVAGRGDSQSKHTRSILIPRSVAVNVEAEAEYISRRRNEVSLVVNKHRQGAWPGARAHHSLTGILFPRQASRVN